MAGHGSAVCLSMAVEQWGTVRELHVCKSAMAFDPGLSCRPGSDVQLAIYATMAYMYQVATHARVRAVGLPVRQGWRIASCLLFGRLQHSLLAQPSFWR